MNAETLQLARIRHLDFWLNMHRQPPPVFPAGTLPYDPSVDYAGPQNRWIGKWIPDTIYGVSINEECYQHDWGYALEVADEDRDERRQAEDLQFYAGILIKIKDSDLNWFMKFLARRRALKYYIAVDLFGDKYYALPSLVAQKTIERATT